MHNATYLIIKLPNVEGLQHCCCLFFTGPQSQQPPVKHIPQLRP